MRERADRREPGIPTWARRHRLWLVAVVAAVPLLGLLALQYHWMRSVEANAAIVEQARLDNALEAITAKTETFYRGEGERALALPPALFTEGPIEKAAYYFKKKGSPAARHYFVAPLMGEKAGSILYYDPRNVTLVEPPWGGDVRAAYAATAAWKTLAHKGGTFEDVALQVDERDPNHRLLIQPITDESSRLVGLAGMIVDRDYFESQMLTPAVRKSLNWFFPRGGSRQPWVTVSDGRERHLQICATGEAKAIGDPSPPPGTGRDSNAGNSASARFTFLFSDHQLRMSGREADPVGLARRNFAINLALSALLGLTVVGGLAFALRAAAREIKLSAMKSEFVSNVSHELRTPLASIRVFGELLRLGRVEDPAKVREYGDYIETESRRLTQLIGNILDFSRIESGRKEYRFAPADLEAVVVETLRAFRPSLEQSGFRLAYRREGGPLPSVTIDAPAIAQSLANLVDNAVKYSGEARDIEVGLRRQGDEAMIWVRDHGIGIERDEQAKIFDRFHRVPTGLVHDVKGSGLGLAIVRHIAEAHHGRVEVESRPGGGSTFALSFPIGAVEAMTNVGLVGSEG